MSKTAEKYNENEFEKLWNSAKLDRSISVGTLFYHAKSHASQVQLSPVQESANDDAKDVRNSRLYADANRGKLLFINETNDVLIYSSEGWQRAHYNDAVKAAKDVIATMRIEAYELFKQSFDNSKAKELNKHADYSSTSQRIDAMINLAKSEDGMSEFLRNFDANPNLLGVKNGVLNLKEKELIPIEPKLLVSMRANVDFDPLSKCPTFMKFISEIQPEAESRRLLQQIAGVFLCGDSGIQKLIFFYGHGANGKTTFIELCSWILGDYTKRIATEMLMQHQRSPQGPSPDIVGLKGRRMVYCNEVEEGRHLAEGRVKELTGGDTLTGRVPYAPEDISFQPTHKLVMVGNHQPEIHDMSHGMWRRVLLFPFNQTIASDQCDPNLQDKLKTEGSGILNWMLDGYHDYLKAGLTIPLSISQATDAYKDEQDIMGEWLQDHCNISASGRTDKHSIYRAYQLWNRSRGLGQLAQRRFTKRLSDRGYKLDPGKRNILGLELNNEGRLASLTF
jgi:putative DNA primase/helicase